MKSKQKSLFRALYEEDIEVKVDRVYDGRVELTLYKNGIIDAMLLDEAFGPLGWRKENHVYLRNDGTEKLVCTISVFDEKTGTWVDKDGVGVETNWEAEKGQETDAFKRAGFNWGIGRELKNHMPKLSFSEDECTIIERTDEEGNRYKSCRDNFEVLQVLYDDDTAFDRRITAIAIRNNNTNVTITYDIREILEQKRAKLAKAKSSSSGKTGKKAKADNKTNVCTPTLEKPLDTSSEGNASELKSVLSEVEEIELELTPMAQEPEATEDVFDGAPGDMPVPFGRFQTDGKTLKDLRPDQVRWCFTKPEAPKALKTAIIALAQTDDKLRQELISHGINPAAA